jgi:hypothetical protein
MHSGLISYIRLHDIVQVLFVLRRKHLVGNFRDFAEVENGTAFLELHFIESIHVNAILPVVNRLWVSIAPRIVKYVYHFLVVNQN